MSVLCVRARMTLEQDSRTKIDYKITQLIEVIPSQRRKVMLCAVEYSILYNHTIFKTSWCTSVPLHSDPELLIRDTDIVNKQKFH
jgi:hypothetical protein